MTGIYFDSAVRLKSYSSASKGGKTTIKIELESTDRYDVASVLRQLDEFDAAQRLADKPARKTAPPRQTEKPLAIAAPLLQIEDHSEGQP